MSTKTSSSSTTIVSVSNQNQNQKNSNNIYTANVGNLDFDDFTSSSILEFLNKEQECFYGSSRDTSEINDEIIFEQVNRLADNSDTRSVDEILREAELLINNQLVTSTTSASSVAAVVKGTNGGFENYKKSSLINSECGGHSVDIVTPSCVVKESSNSEIVVNNFDKVVDNVHLDSVISDESTPKDMRNFTANNADTDDIDEDITDTIEEITEGIETIELFINEDPTCGMMTYDTHFSNELENGSSQAHPRHQLTASSKTSRQNSVDHVSPSSSHKPCTPSSPTIDTVDSGASSNSEFYDDDEGGLALPPHSQVPRSTQNYTQTEFAYDQRRRINQQQRVTSSKASENKTFADKSTNSSPKHLVSKVTSPIESLSITREHVLKHEIEQLQEKLKDTEERLQSLRIQHDSLSQLHRDLRENNTHLQEESEILKLDVQHLNECANILRSELQAARSDRNEALDLQRVLQSELEDSRNERKKAQEQKEKDTKTILDLQRQCREMERILMRKHPDSVSALIVASKNPNKSSANDDSHSRRLLEQRIAQLEADAKEQDIKAQKILANVQARFNSVQSKYETHIADLETQVLSLQEINTKLNEKIESQVRTLDYFVSKKSERYHNGYTQTEEIPERQRRTVTSYTQTDCVTSYPSLPVTTTTNNVATNTSSANTSASSTPSNSRPSSKQSGLKKPTATSKLPFSQSDSTISSVYHAAAKEDAHLLATIRGMRVDLAIKDKAMQRLTRELDECKRTIRKLQKEKEALKSDKLQHNASSSSSSRKIHHDSSQFNSDQSSDSQALKEALNKIKLLEFDYKALHDKRLQDLKTLQTAHERELSSCHETVRILQQRLTERDEAYAMQKRRKVPVDYYALKAKVSSLERRHSEREERLHMLVEALSKGRLNGALEDLISDNNN
ncbi:centrosomal protein of 162 kDa isoform X2 [Episyrphus balteatus]|uniref:centrosomal protein of 162 kDa isoform X2 n=1 Tax=Episyrphus balteatus TaxID=286459 RepID=UPI0024851BCB|nr:centrosomal protein of 162 kDa isoform X2 [Episyrphus balteatus]